MRSPRALLDAKIGLWLCALGSACSEVYGTPIVDVVAGRGGALSTTGGVADANGGLPNAGSSSGGSDAGNTANANGGTSARGGSGSGGASDPIASCPNSLLGFASVGEPATGGLLGKTVRATDADELKKFATDPAPLTIEIATSISLDEQIRPTSNKTLIGVDASGALIGGGLYILGVKNIIVRNLSISMVGKDIGDAIGIQSSEHVWIDHCDFYSNLTDPKGTYDGLVDITHGSDYVTVSWNDFHDHYNASLISHSEAAADEDVGHLKVTLHHNWFHRLLGYAPRARFGQVHIFNNFYQDVDATAVISESNADVYVESNAFNRVLSPLVTHYEDALDGKAVAVDNDRVDSGVPMIGAPSTWLPSSAYAYRTDLPDSVPSLVSKCAGVGNL